MLSTFRDHLARSAARTLAYPLAVAPSPLLALDAIIIMGAPLRDDGGLTSILQERVTIAAELWHQHPSMWVVPSGGVTNYPHASEASAMATALCDLGVRQDRLLVESQARNTFENGHYSATMLRHHGAHTAWVVTQPFHLKRAVHCCRQAGIEAQGWLIYNGIEQARPLSAIRWSLREYAAWFKAYCR
jgi:uncharacterized SAM-binding protein YcdF (DUF218 family)